MQGSRRLSIRQLARAGIFLCVFTVALGAVTGCEQWTRMEDNQVRLQAMVAANARQLATLSSQVHTGQGTINESIQQLDADTRTVAAEVLEAQDQQHQLQQTVVAGHEGLDRRVTQLDKNQEILQASVTEIAGVTGRTASDLTALATEHAALHETVRANQQEMTRSVAAVVGNQQRIQAGVTHLQQNDEALATDITSLAAAQATAQETLQANHEEVKGRFASLADTQQQLQGQVGALGERVDRKAGDLAAAMASVQSSVTAGRDDLASRIAGLSEEQQTLQAGIDTLSGKADQSVVDLAAANSSLQETLRINQDVLTGQMAASIQHQQALQLAVRDLHTKADGLAESVDTVSVGQASLRQAMGTNHDAVITATTGLSNGQQALHRSVEALDGRTGRIADELTAVAAEQKALHRTVEDNNGTVAATLTGLSEGQAGLQADVSRLNEEADTMAAAMTAAAERQTAMQQSIVGGNEALATQVTSLADKQQTLRDGLAAVDTRTRQISTDTATIAAGQETMHQALHSHAADVDGKLASLAEEQALSRGQMDTMIATSSQTALDVLALGEAHGALGQTMQAGLDGLGERTAQVAADVQNVAAEQIAIRDTMNANHQAISDHAAVLTRNQQALRTDIGSLGQKTDQLTTDLSEVASAQASLGDALRGHAETTGTQMTALADSQRDVAASLDVLTATTGQASLDIIALTDHQNQLAQRVAAGMADLGRRTDTVASGLNDVASAQASVQETLSRQNDAVSGLMTQVADNHQQMQDGLDVLTAMAGQTALDVITLTNSQEMIRRSLQGYHESMDVRLAGLVESRQQVQSGLDVVTATMGQTALDVISLGNSQKMIRDSLRNYSESMDARLAGLAEGQQQVQSGLDVATATMGQTALDVIALSNGQDDLAQALQTDRRELTARLTEITQSQQTWLERLNAAKAGTETMGDRIVALDLQVATLQEALQAAVEDMTARLGTDGQQRQQLEAVISQDIQALLDSVAQLRQAQTSLQEQMTQVHMSTQLQTESLKSALEQMRQPPAEVKVSDAKPQTPAPVVQTGE